jgi:hypothetical protein
MLHFIKKIIISNKAGVFMEKCKFCEREFERHTSRVYHQNRCSNNPNRKEQWNKGLTKNDPRVAKYSESMKKTKNTKKWKKQHYAWNKDLTKNDPRVAKYSESAKKTKNTKKWKEQHLNNVYTKYNGKHFTQTEEYKENRKNIMLDKYGVEHPLQCPEIFEKAMNNRYKRHEYVLPSGKIIKIQGYEPYALDKLFEDGFNEFEIETKVGNMPKIEYELNGKTKRYFPDIFNRRHNLFIEVKSLYTIKDNKKMNLAKHNGTKELGYNHEVWICDPKTSTIQVVENLNEYYAG